LPASRHSDTIPQVLKHIYHLIAFFVVVYGNILASEGVELQSLFRREIIITNSKQIDT
jgi:hypothetical protein